jgi:phosphate transport system permease protein
MNLDPTQNGYSHSPSFFQRRYAIAAIWNKILLASTVVGIIVLITLLITVINQSIGLVAIEYQIDPSLLADAPLENLTSQELITILQEKLTRYRFRTLDREKPLIERSQADLLELVNEKVVDPKVIASWHLIPSITQRDQISELVKDKYPNAILTFRSWLNWDFIARSMSSRPELAGVRIAIKGSIFIVFIAIILALPLGVGAAIYLEEYAHPSKLINRIIQTNIDNLAGVPSIIYGILGLAVFVRALSPITSGALFGLESNTSRNILSAGLTMGLLILPMFIINAQEAIRSVPISLRYASYSLGATKWQTIRSHVLPSAMTGILTGSILAISRAFGETAPLIVVGASTFITSDPTSPFSGFSALPILIYNWTTRPQDQFRNIAAAAIIVLLISLLTINAFAIILRNRLSEKRM